MFHHDLPFHYDRGETGAAWPVETTGGGVGLLDYDGDGRLDLLFRPGGADAPGQAAAPSADVLLQNRGGGRLGRSSLRASGLQLPRDTGRVSPWPTTTATAIPTST